MDNNPSLIASILKSAQSILFITGAGLSADSGLPTYRGIGGLYEGQTTEDGIPIEAALAGQMLRERPEVTWKYLSQIDIPPKCPTCARTARPDGSVSLPSTTPIYCSTLQQAHHRNQS